MNERLEELAKQCYIISGHPQIDGSYFDKEKFAELIIQECGIALNPMLRDMISRGHAHDLIKKHFGINQGIVSGGGGGYEGPRIGGKGGRDDSTFVCPPEENGPNMFSKYDGDGR